MKTKIAILLCVICASAVKAQWPYAGETVPQSQTVLNSYFVTNATPNPIQFAEFIDTMFYYINSTYTNSLAAENAVNSITNNTLLCRAMYLGYLPASSTTWTTYKTFNVSGVSQISSYNFNFAFTNAMPDTNFFIIFSGDSWSTNTGGLSANSYPAITGKSTTNVFINFGVANTSIRKFGLLIFD